MYSLAGFLAVAVGAVVPSIGTVISGVFSRVVSALSVLAS